MKDRNKLSKPREKIDNRNKPQGNKILKLWETNFSTILIKMFKIMTKNEMTKTFTKDISKNEVNKYVCNKKDNFWN